MWVTCGLPTMAYNVSQRFIMTSQKSTSSINDKANVASGGHDLNKIDSTL
jgi:hypothetical protein